MFMELPSRRNDQAYGPTFVDVCGLKAGITRIAYELGLLRNAVVLTTVSREVLSLLMDSDPERHQAGLQAVITLLTLHAHLGVEVIMDGEAPRNGHADPHLLQRAEAIEGRILTADRGLQEQARQKRVEIVSVQELHERFRPVSPKLAELFPPLVEISVSKILKLWISKPGSRANEGIGYLDDGRMVIIAEGRSFIGEEVEVRVEHISQNGQGKETIFARMVNGIPSQ